MYPAELVQPMKDELIAVGFDELADASAVDTALAKEGTTLLVVNSVCGCAAANARPGVCMSLANKKIQINSQLFLLGLIVKPQTLLASKWAISSSSPSIALFKDGELVHMLERHHIEGRPAKLIAENLIEAFNIHC